MKMKKVVIALMLVLASFTVTAQAQKSEFKYKVNKKENYVTITGWKGKGTCCVIPDEINGFPVEVIGKKSLRGKNIQHVVLPKNLKNIELGAFNILSSINTIEVPAFTNEIFFFDTYLISIGFQAWWRVQDFKPGVYTMTSGAWLLNGEIPLFSTLLGVVVSQGQYPGVEFEIRTINGLKPILFLGGYMNYVMKPGTYKIGFGIKNTYSKTYYHEFVIEAGKEYQICYYLDGFIYSSYEVIFSNVTFFERTRNF